MYFFKIILKIMHKHWEILSFKKKKVFCNPLGFYFFGGGAKDLCQIVSMLE